MPCTPHPGPSDVHPEELPCRTVEGDLWFADDPDLVERAKGWCRLCPVRRSCLEGALERREEWGVWGGELFDRGVVVPRKRRRGRPRKSGPEGEIQVA